jgi:hypothetical protein
MLLWEGDSRGKMGWKEKLSGRKTWESDLPDIWGVWKNECIWVMDISVGAFGWERAIAMAFPCG